VYDKLADRDKQVVCPPVNDVGGGQTALFADGGTLLASLDTKSRVTRALFSPDGRRILMTEAIVPILSA